jgi:hypothetical protein
MDAAVVFAMFHPLTELDICMNSKGRNLRILARHGFMVGMLFLSACLTIRETKSEAQLLVESTAQIVSASCEACYQATLAAALTQGQSNFDNQAAATAEIVRANAQSTLDAANATLSAAQTQDQNDANVVAAQIAAAAEIVRANAQATINAAGSTQYAALTQDAIGQTQMADLATSGAQSILNQQNSNMLAAGTQTAIADTIATQTQVAAATSQWYVDQSRRREEQRQGPIAFLWMWCLPMFLLLIGGLCVWGFWRWLKIQQANQRILQQPVERLPASVVEILPSEDHGPRPYIESDLVDDDYPPTRTDDQMRGWLDEVKRNLRGSDEKDENDNANQQ